MIIIKMCAMRQDEIMNNELKSTQNHYKYMYLHNTDI